jgi:hypothetical protein
MPGGSVYKDDTFNKETSQYIARIFTVQYKYKNITKQKKTRSIYCPVKNPGRQALYSSSLHSLKYADPVM